MSGILVLVLRILMAGALYAFLGWAIYTLWGNLRQESAAISNRQIPTIKIEWQCDDQQFIRQFTIPEVSIGRDPNCDCPLPDETVSAHHARLIFHHNQWWIEDLLSTNGTFLNQERLEVPTVIISGDEFRCGQIDFDVQIEEK